MTDTLKFAKPEEIVKFFNTIAMDDRIGDNWGTGDTNWDIPGTITYINGVMLMIDEDLNAGYLLEICDVVENGGTFVKHLHYANYYIAGEDYAWAEHEPFPYSRCPVKITNQKLYTDFIEWYTQSLKEVNEGPTAL